MMNYPCHIPLIVDADDPRKYVAPKNDGCFLIFTERHLLDQWFAKHHPGQPRMSFDSATPAQLLERLEKLQPGLFQTVLLDQGKAPNDSVPEPIAQFVARLKT